MNTLSHMKQNKLIFRITKAECLLKSNMLPAVRLIERDSSLLNPLDLSNSDSLISTMIKRFLKFQGIRKGFMNVQRIKNLFYNYILWCASEKKKIYWTLQIYKTLFF